MFGRQPQAPANPQRIAFTVATGEKYLLSNQVYGGSSPMKGNDAIVQIGLIMENLLYFAVDDGTLIMTKHIVSARIEE